MTTDRILDRVRAANPAPAATFENHELFAQIVASPGDPRLTTETKRSRRRMRTRRGHTLALFGAWAALAASGTAAAAKLGWINIGVFARDTPAQLFKDNPAAAFPHSPHQVVNPRTVHRVASMTVPALGTYEYWIALTKKGWLCNAIRMPDGAWADVSLKPDRYQISGPVPACEGWGWPYHGFSYYPSSVRGPDGRGWRMIWGYGPSVGHPVRVRDRFSGVTAPIGDGRYSRSCSRTAASAAFQAARASQIPLRPASTRPHSSSRRSTRSGGRWRPARPTEANRHRRCEPSAERQYSPRG